MALKKIFSGSEILANNLKAKLEEIAIVPVVRNNMQSARLAGFGNIGTAVELFIEEFEMEKAEPIIEDFKMNL